MCKTTILIPLPAYGFDPTETAIPWKILAANGIGIVFSTPTGQKPAADRRMLDGGGLGIWKSILMAGTDAINAYKEMVASEAFNQPLLYSNLTAADFDGLLLPGGHDKGVREYLESGYLQSLAIEFFTAKKPVAAICHGVVLLARSIDPVTNKSVIHDYTTTSLLQQQELLAFNLTRYWLKDYYLTYPGKTVEAEVRNSLASQFQFKKGPLPIFRDNLNHLGRGFVVKDRNYVSARWPGDAHRFAQEFLCMLKEK
jgi:putative intracellular protease/amidase